MGMCARCFLTLTVLPVCHSIMSPTRRVPWNVLLYIGQCSPMPFCRSRTVSTHASYPWPQTKTICRDYDCLTCLEETKHETVNYKERERRIMNRQLCVAKRSKNPTKAEYMRTCTSTCTCRQGPHSPWKPSNILEKNSYSRIYWKKP